jgi:hypothetical protein
VLFVDEVGANTSQKEDGNIRGSKFVVVRGMRPQEWNSYSDSYLTVLGLTVANDAPIVCAVIVTVKQLTVLEASGINYLSENLMKAVTLE